MFGAYQRWCRTTSTRAQYFEKMPEMCGLIDDPDCPKARKHRQLERADIKRSEDTVLLRSTRTTSTAWQVELDVLRAKAVG